MSWVIPPAGDDISVTEIESLGKHLKRERELKKISLREIAKNTRVREHLLKAIEEDRYELLPSPTYVRGFLLAYAQYIKLNPQEVLLRYERFLKKESVVHLEAEFPRRVFWNKKQPWIVIGVIVISLIASYFLHPYRSKLHVEPISMKPEVQKAFPSVPSTQTSEATSIHGERPFSLMLKAVEKTWVRIRVNGQPEKEMIFKPGEGGSYQALSRIYLTIGNAGGLEMIFNEKTLEKFGKSGEVVNLTFTPQGVEVKSPVRGKTP